MGCYVQFVASHLVFVNFHNVFVEIVSSLDYFLFLFVIVVIVVGQHIEVKRK